MRTGLVTKKLGMTRVFTADGRHVPVTVLSLEGCRVVAQRAAGTIPHARRAGAHPLHTRGRAAR